MKCSVKYGMALILFMSFNLGYSTDLNSNTNQANCEDCSLHILPECNTGLGDFENLEFASLYRYNSTNFTTCDFNDPDSIANIEDRIQAIVEELKAHENHVYKMTHTIKRGHKNLMEINTEASFNYVVILDSNSTHHQEIIDYGIKLKL